MYDTAPLFETSRLRFTRYAPEARSTLLQVYDSNRDYLSLTGESPEGALADDEKDLRELAGCTVAALWRREDGQVAGVASFLQENPRDGKPWLGLLMVHGGLHGQGYGSEAVDGLLRHFREQLGWQWLRLGVITRNEKARRFWERHGFHAYTSTVKAFPIGQVPILCMERRL